MEPNAESATVTPDAAQPLRREIRSWGRDLLIALSLAVVIIIFFYQPVKVEGTSMTPLISRPQERIFINKFVYRFEPIERVRCCCFLVSSGPGRNLSSSAWSDCLEIRWRFAEAVCS